MDGVSFQVRAGESFALVGESGCGKSVTALSIIQLVQSPSGYIAGGEIAYRGKDIVHIPETEKRTLRGNEISMIFQEPMTSLNPVFTVEQQLTEVMRRHQGPEPEGGTGRGAPDAGTGEDAGTRPAVEGVPPPALGRDETARDDRHGPGLSSRAPDRRRTDNRTRRDDPGTDPLPDARASQRVRHRCVADHPRPRCGGGERGPRGRDVRGQDRGGRQPGADPPQPGTSVHGEAARFSPVRRKAEGGLADHRREGPAGHGLPCRLPIRTSLPQGDGDLQGDRSGADSCRERTAGRLCPLR